MNAAMDCIVAAGQTVEVDPPTTTSLPATTCALRRKWRDVLGEAGIEPAPGIRKLRSHNDLRRASKNSLSNLGSKTVDSLPAELRSVVEVWARLPEAVRARIVGVVEGAAVSAGEG
ncbi:MAG: hypothetical protein V1790_14390 [Planctomycetota bacterium]